MTLRWKLKEEITGKPICFCKINFMTFMIDLEDKELWVTNSFQCKKLTDDPSEYMAKILEIVMPKS